METKAGQSVSVRVWRVPTPSPRHTARTQQAAGKAQARFSLFFWGQLRMFPSQFPLNVNQFVEYNFNHPATLLSCVGDAILEKSRPKLNCIWLFFFFITEAGGRKWGFEKLGPLWCYHTEMFVFIWGNSMHLQGVCWDSRPLATGLLSPSPKGNTKRQILTKPTEGHLICFKGAEFMILALI